ncbi:DUF6443 domain-containing protein [Chryseobacterium sp. PMSZPI]|uniref:DUF6443 domain-containing protein n=1 Tax=Chryseobacterium sp. PMSZPI TaxID=1033900 RepID=UPI001E36A5AD|nr:DUF6443 domain-containing protein [Chryseobacterium sp. PMSZPI]
MKKLLNIAILMFSAGYSYAQTLNATPTENYTYSKTCLDENCIKKTEEVKYFDGLGRPKQVIGIRAAPSGKDIVAHTEYDQFGRVTKDYLPIPQSGTQNGGLYAAPLGNAAAVFGGEKIYSEKQLENSPLSRINSITPLGNDWASRPLQMGYAANTAGEVKKYIVTTSWVNNATFSTLSENGTYGANQLAKNTVTDSDGNTTVEFQNTAGQTVLVRKNDGTQNVDTYYVYNEYGQQAFVLPPLAVTASIDQTALDNLCYQYRYDGLGRLVEKKLPSKGWEYMAYDKADRLVLSQDATLRTQNKWLITKYDPLGRVAYTGLLEGGDRLGRQNNISNGIIIESRNNTGFTRNGITVYYSDNNFVGEIPTILSVNYYDTYPPDSPSKPTQVFGQDIISDDMGTSLNTKGLPTASYIKNIEDDNWTKNWNWYDSKLRVIGTSTTNHLGGYTNTESKLDFAGVPQQTKVYHKRLITDTEKVITQYFDYDEGNRLLVHRHQVDNNPVEILAQNEYNELSQLKNKKLGGTTPSTALQSIDYTYDIRGALIKINDPANLNGKFFGYGIKYTNPEYTNIASGKYNGTIAEIDWRNASDNVLKRYTYTYDGLNRLKDAIYSEPNSTNPFNNYYNESMTYDLGGNIKNLKRNAFPISGNTATMVDDLSYQYTGNRLDKVVENALNNTGYEGGNNLISYDVNGNMKDMLDKEIESITYNYLNLANHFTIQHSSPFGQPSSTSIGYVYRGDGVKLRKNYYNVMGRGVSVTRITDYLDGFQYTYEDNGGICLTCKSEVAYEQQAYKSIITPGLPIFSDWKLDFVATAEGFYSFTQNRYIYQYKDHLGNVRVSFAKNSAGAPEIIDTNNYYPFGLNHIGGGNSSNFGSFNSYKYNTKELQETGFYDYGARMYMPDLGRWGVVDPLAESTRRLSPYNYALDNPINFIDPDGRKAVMPMFPNPEGLAVPVESFWWINTGLNPTGTVNGYVVRALLGGPSPSFQKEQTFGETELFRQLMAFAYFRDIDFSKFGAGLKDIDDPNPIRKYLKNESNFNKWSGIETTKMQYQLDHSNAILEFKQTINKTEKYIGYIDKGLEWTPALTGIKSLYDFIKEGAKSLNPTSLIFTLGASTIALENYQTGEFLDMYKNIQSNYFDIHSKNPNNMKGITVNIDMIKGPQNHIWTKYSFYDIYSHRYLGGRTFE